MAGLQATVWDISLRRTYTEQITINIHTGTSTLEVPFLSWGSNVGMATGPNRMIQLTHLQRYMRPGEGQSRQIECAQFGCRHNSPAALVRLANRDLHCEQRLPTEACTDREAFS